MFISHPLFHCKQTRSRMPSLVIDTPVKDPQFSKREITLVQCFQTVQQHLLVCRDKRDVFAATSFLVFMNSKFPNCILEKK